ncbi:GNAT family N-acetyltransferase [Methylocaldum sp. GT1BB]|uniref:GNAT family N-acetyltransferase n=1 Tax=Methylocaldum sp. GT1BB TaxID=3438963 RepID=UPI003DA05103
MMFFPVCFHSMAMSKPIEFDTERLRLRQWRIADLEPFAQLNADPRVAETFQRPAIRSVSTVCIACPKRDGKAMRRQSSGLIQMSFNALPDLEEGAKCAGLADKSPTFYGMRRFSLGAPANLRIAVLERILRIARA